MPKVWSNVALYASMNVYRFHFMGKIMAFSSLPWFYATEEKNWTTSRRGPNKYKERLRLYKRWPCSTYILNRVNWIESVMWSARFLSHMNHVSVSPTDGNGPTQGQRKTLTKKEIEPTTFGLDLRRSTDWATRSNGSQAVGTEDVKVTAMNMYKYKERLRLYKRWPCSTYILNRVNWIECNVKC